MANPKSNGEPPAVEAHGPRIVIAFAAPDSPDAGVSFEGVTPLQAYAAVWLLGQAAADLRAQLVRQAVGGLIVPPPGTRVVPPRH